MFHNSTEMTLRSILQICRRCEQYLTKTTLGIFNIRNFMPSASYMHSRTVSCLVTVSRESAIPLEFSPRFGQSRLLYCSKLVGRMQTVDPFKNPIDDIQTCVEVPILPDERNIFNPSRKEMLAAAQLFTPSYKHDIKFLTSAVRPDQLPDTNVPEVAFIGRSNVGKSSLIQAIFQRATDVLVKVSKKPGHTRTLNFFQVGRCLTLVDMPGYGYNMPGHFVESVEGYLHGRKGLCRTFLLVDSVLGLTKADWSGLEMMEEAKTPYCIIMTKCDKASKHVLLRNLMNVKKVQEENTHCCFPQLFLLSSLTGAGVPLLQAFIAYVTGNLSVKGV